MYLTIYKQNINNLNYYKTTILITNPKPFTDLTQTQKQKIMQAENYIQEAWKILEPYEDNYETQYYEFKIPKRTGGLRTIDAPNTDFKMALSKVKDIFEQNIKCLAHNSAYAYTKQRSVLDALKIHQANQSQWYLKIDLTNFFPNCTPELVYTQLKQLYPFYYFSEKYNELLKKIIKTCSLRNGLPQGTPISPLFTNLIMVPYDYTINNALKRGIGEHWVYTRYADDILISSKSDFDWKKLESVLAMYLKPFQIKHEKTRYGSRAGSNWNLGLMLNKDNNITLGSNRKRTINAMLNNFIRDTQNNTPWNRDDIYQLQGYLSYLKQIEPDYYNYMVQKYEAKYNVQDCMKLIQNNL